MGPHKHFSQKFDLGFVSIVGPNGIGKSFVAEALAYALFGTWVTDRGNQSSYMGKDSYVEVVVSIQGDDYTIYRTMKELIVFDKNGTALTKELKRSSKEFIESLVGDKDNFLHCCFVAQATDSYDIMKCEPAARMNVLRYFLKLDVFEEYLEEVKTLHSKSKAECLAIENRINLLPSLEESKNAKLKGYEEARATLSRLNQKKVSLNERIDKHLDVYEK